MLGISLLIHMNMDSDMDIVREELISMDEVKTWSIEALKDFCRKRGFRCTGSKQDLIARVYVLFNEPTIKEIPGAKEQETSRKQDYKTIVNAGLKAPDPLKITNGWIGTDNGLKLWPPLSIVELSMFLIKNGVTLTNDTLTSYKTGKGYAYHYADWLREVHYHPITKYHKACYLKANCTPSNRLNDLPHNVWIKVLKENGQILSAYCSCMAG